MARPVDELGARDRQRALFGVPFGAVAAVADRAAEPATRPPTAPRATRVGAPAEGSKFIPSRFLPPRPSWVAQAAAVLHVDHMAGFRQPIDQGGRQMGFFRNDPHSLKPRFEVISVVLVLCRFCISVKNSPPAPVPLPRTPPRRSPGSRRRRTCGGPSLPNGRPATRTVRPPVGEGDEVAAIARSRACSRKLVASRSCRSRSVPARRCSAFGHVVEAVVERHDPFAVQLRLAGEGERLDLQQFGNVGPFATQQPGVVALGRYSASSTCFRAARARIPAPASASNSSQWASRPPRRRYFRIFLAVLHPSWSSSLSRGSVRAPPGVGYHPRAVVIDRTDPARRSEAFLVAGRWRKLSSTSTSGSGCCPWLMQNQAMRSSVSSSTTR
jgi:hypothetical protein